MDRARAWIARWGLVAGLVFAYLYAFPYFPKIHSANETPRVYLVRAIADHGTFTIEDQVRPDDITGDMSMSGGHTYSNKAPGSSMLAAPPYWLVAHASRWLGLGEPSFALTLWLCRVWTGVIPTLLFVALLWRFLARWAPKPETRRLVIVAYALGSMAMTYSILFIAHQLSAVCIGTAWIVSVWVADDDLDVRWMLAAGAAAGAAPLVDYQAAFAGVPIAIYLVARLWRERPRLVRASIYAAAAAAVPIAILLAYHWACFGSPLRTGYDANQAYHALHEQGFLGLSRFRADAFYGSTVAPDNGLFFLSPWLLAAIPGVVLLWRGGQARHAAVIGACGIIYIAFVSSLAMWHGGWSLGPRYITAVLPFLVAGVAVTAAWADDDPRRWWARALVIGAVIVGVVIYATSCAEYPHFPAGPAGPEKFLNPLYEITFRLVRDGHAPWSLGSVLGLRGVPSLAPYFLVIAALVAWAARRDARATALGVAIAITTVAAYALAPRGGPAADSAYAWIVTTLPM